MEPRLTPPDGGFGTRAVQSSAVRPQVDQGAVSPAIWPSSTWVTDRSSQLGDLLEDRQEGYVYGRYDNPTNTVLHTAVASLEGAESAWSFSSGTAAINAALHAARGGGRVLATREPYGGTYALFDLLRRDSGWEVDLVDLTQPDALERNLTDEHTMVYTETIANPTTTVADVARLGEQCRERGLRLVVDNTFASPYLCRPIELGASLVVESATKYLGGHGDVVAGVLAGTDELIAAARRHAFEYGGSLGPFEAWLVLRGIQTLQLRMERASANALAVAQRLEDHGVLVRYPGLASHPQFALADAMFGKRGFGAVLSFDLADRDAAERFVDGCNVFATAVSLGATHSLALHPASTTHRQLSDADLAAAGIKPGMVRVAVGIEDVEDLLADVDRGLDAAGHPTG